MSVLRFLLDENMPRALAAALRRREPGLDVRRIGQSDTPALGTKDPQLLQFCAQSCRILVSRDRATMPQHIADHLAGDGHTSGVLLATRRCTLANLTDDLILIWSASIAADWRDVLVYLPLTE